MSAIVGILNIISNEIPLGHFEKLMQGLSHFPTDRIGTIRKNKVFFGCHAQWIQPESIGEQNPFYDREKRLVITSDAIIDNREELFEKLNIPLINRRSLTDTELILYSYHKWGVDTPKYLIGDFAFMIWDERKNQLFGARDFSGTRTLYYSFNSEFFSFCTTIKPLLSLPFYNRKLNEQWLAEYLAIPGMFETVDASITVYKGIEQIPPSHSIIVKDGVVSLSRYSTIRQGERLILKSNSEYEEAFREVFKTAVKARIRTKRNVGAHLSGGLDSGSVVSFAAAELALEDKKLQTYSYVPANNFKQWTPKHRIADERPFIQSTVNHVGNITDNYLNFEQKSPYSEIDSWLDVYEMPYKFFHNSYWVKGVYEKANQDGVGLLLNGSRGNWTVSWGPALEYQAMLLRKMNIIKFYKELSLYSNNIGVKKSRILSNVSKKAFPTIFKKLKMNYEIPKVINEQFANQTRVFEKLYENDIEYTEATIPNAYEARKSHFEKLTYWNTNGTTISKLSLRYKLWNRDPTNDLRIIRFCLSLPESQNVQDGVDRSLIRRATKGLLPDKVRLNQKVRGIQGSDSLFRMIPRWNEFIHEIDRMLLDPITNEYFNKESINLSLLKIRNNPKPEYIYSSEFTTLMRSLITYRFLQRIN